MGRGEGAEQKQMNVCMYCICRNRVDRNLPIGLVFNFSSIPLQEQDNPKAQPSRMHTLALALS